MLVRARVLRSFLTRRWRDTAVISVGRWSSSEGIQHEKKRDKENQYSHTLNLPNTDFSQHANAQKREPELQKWWEEHKIYDTLVTENSGPVFTIHDGPPYANGELHIGHALNKILKDIINRFEILRGKRVRYVPGWDCHGLPIEMKVLQSLTSSERRSLTAKQTRSKAAEFANAAIGKQLLAFKRFGIWGDFDTPYSTMQPQYEGAQIRVFGEMFKKGYIYRSKKPVHWSPSSRTALAEAELEYPDNHVSKSVYVAFLVKDMSPSLENFINNCLKNDSSNVGRKIHLAVWTTTPWTLPANQAVAVNEDIEYCLVQHPDVMSGDLLIMAKDLVPKFGTIMGLIESEGKAFNTISYVNNDKVVDTFAGSALVETTYHHPLNGDVRPVIVGGDYINTESGTALVHTAPGHGLEDFLVGKKHNLPLVSPVDDAGLFTAEAGDHLNGLSVLGEGNDAVIEMLKNSGQLLLLYDYAHKYPYDWRTKKPTILRTTYQWFANVSSFREMSLKAIDEVLWTPISGRNRIQKMVESREEWCISRQRSWGVPIPVFYHLLTHEPLMTQETIDHIAFIFEWYGSDAWWALSEAELLPAGRYRNEAEMYYKGMDTMDVWFDSGTSWSGVLESREGLNFPADLYLEGSDQHRGWFQSSLLTSVATRGIAPYKAVLTHGFVLDEKGEKMSKSLKNVVDPMTIINGAPSNSKAFPAYGADTLRLWVASVDYTSDVCVGNNIIRHVSDACRKLRNTFRYLLGNLSDFVPESDSVPIEKMASFDRYFLTQLGSIAKSTEAGYSSFDFLHVYNSVLQFMIKDLSSFYLDASKDRLYVSHISSFRRRSCQTVLHIMLQQLLSITAPIVPHLAEDVWQHLPYPTVKKSVFFNKYIPHPEILDIKRSEQDTFWERIGCLRNDVNGCIELARKKKVMGASQEAEVYLYIPDEEFRKQALACSLDQNSSILEGGYVNDLRFVLIVSKVNIVKDPNTIISECPEFSVSADSSSSKMAIGIKRSGGKKCERCWYYCESVGSAHFQSPSGPISNICGRCAFELRWSTIKE